MEGDLLTTDQVAAKLGVPVRTLRQWRYLGRGPTFIKLGPKSVRYAAGDIDTWLHAQRTTQTGPRPASSPASA